VSLPESPRQARIGRQLADLAAKLRRTVEIACRGRFSLDLDEIEQETRIRLWKALDSDRIEVLGASYVQKVVASVIIDAGRRAAVRAAEPLPESDDEAGPAGLIAEGADRAAMDGEHMQRVLRCIEALPIRRRLPVKLHLQGYSLPEIAELEGVSAEAVRKLVTRGLDELKTALREQGLGDFDD
jgi:RNA polymerase sigma-70 factor (ECF subfamily)